MATFTRSDDLEAAEFIDANLRATTLAGPAAVVLRVDAMRWLDGGPYGAPFDLVIVDPPYAETDLLRRVLAVLGAPDAPLTDDARVVAKHFWRDRPPERIGRLAAERDRRFGETALTFYRRTTSATSEEPA